MDRGGWWATVHRVTKSRTQRKRLNIHAHTTHVLRERERLTDFKELAFMIMEYGKSKISVGQQSGDPRKSPFCDSGLKATRLENFLLLNGGRSLVL